MDEQSPTTEPLVRGARRRARTQRRIIDSAAELLKTMPPSAIRIADIAARAEVSEASIYGHFTNKQGVVAAVVEHVMDIVEEELLQIEHSDLNAMAKARETGSTYIELLTAHPVLVRYISSGQDNTSSGAVETMVGTRLGSLRLRFETQIQAAVDAAGLSGIDSRLLSHFLFGAWNGVAALGLRRDAAHLGDEDIRRAIEQALGLFDQVWTAQLRLQ